MATVGNLNINVNAKTARFNKKMKGVRGSLKKFGSGLAKIGKKVALFGVALGAVALTALTALTVKGFAAVDSMAKLATSIGGTVNSIQVLRHMAVIGGASIETMDKSLLKMTKNIGEAAQGYSEATETLEILGLTALDLEKMSPEKAFGTIADAMNQLSTDARRADAAQSIFGRGGMQLLPVFKQGSKEIERMTKMVKEFGLEIGDKQAGMVEKANDAWADTKFILAGLGNLMAIQIAPLWHELNKIIQGWIKSAGGMADLSEMIVLAFAKIAAAGVDSATLVQRAWLGMQASIAQVMGEIMRDIAVDTSAGDSLRQLSEQWLFTAQNLGGKFSDKLAEGWSFEKINAKMEELRKRLMEQGIIPSEGGAGAIELTAPSLKGIIDNLQTAIGAFKVEGSVTERQQGKMIQLEKSQLTELSAIRQAVASGGGVLV